MIFLLTAGLSAGLFTVLSAADAAAELTNVARSGTLSQDWQLTGAVAAIGLIGGLAGTAALVLVTAASEQLTLLGKGLNVKQAARGPFRSGLRRTWNLDNLADFFLTGSWGSFAPMRAQVAMKQGSEVEEDDDEAIEGSTCFGGWRNSRATSSSNECATEGKQALPCGEDLDSAEEDGL